MIGQEVTASLKRMLETMRTEVDRSSKNISTAKSSSTAISGTATNYRKIDSKLDETRGLVRDLKKKDRGDKLFVLGALGVLLATVGFILVQRSPEMVKVPVRAAYYQIKYQIKNFVGVQHFEGEKIDDINAAERKLEVIDEEVKVSAEIVPIIATEATVQGSEHYSNTTFAMADNDGPSSFVTFAEYEVERPLFDDQLILIEIKSTDGESESYTVEHKASVEPATSIVTEDANSVESITTDAGIAESVKIDAVMSEKGAIDAESFVNDAKVADNAAISESATLDSSIAESATSDVLISESVMSEVSIPETTPLEASIAETSPLEESIPETAPVEAVAPITDSSVSETSVLANDIVLTPEEKSESIEEILIQVDHPTATISSSSATSSTEANDESTIALPTVQKFDYESDIEDLAPTSQLNVDESSYESDYNSEQ